MAKLETVARLMGHSIAWAEGETFYSHRMNEASIGAGAENIRCHTIPTPTHPVNCWRTQNKAYMALSFLVQLRKQVWPDLPPSEWESRNNQV